MLSKKENIFYQEIVKYQSRTDIITAKLAYLNKKPKILGKEIF